MIEEAAQESDMLESQRRALDRCLAKVGAPQRELLLLSYQPGAKLHEIAARAGRSVEGHYKAVQRLRARLLQCIEGELKRETA
jgi:RNA polymerase sigma-70 factor (ECF subfamily)